MPCAALAQPQLPKIEAAVPARVVAPGYFGTHFHRLVPWDPGDRATAWPTGQVGALRLWASNTSWKQIQPKPGVFDFARTDAYVQAAERNQAELTMVLGFPPQWASARPTEDSPYGPGHAAEPRNLEDWDTFVQTFARRYKGRIKYYELWNEPYFTDFVRDRNKPRGAFYSGDVATMVKLAARTRAILQREDPAARLMSPGFTGSLDRLDLFLANGGGRYIDAVAYHFYADSDADFIRMYTDARAVMTRHGLGALPLLNTESGYAVLDPANPDREPGHRKLDRRTAAAMLARALVLGAELGIETFHQYSWDNVTMGINDPLGRRTESTTAYESVRRWLVGTTMTGCQQQDDRVMACSGERDGRRLLIVWRADRQQEVRLRLPGLRTATTVESAIDGPLQPVGPERDSIELGGVPVAVWLPR